MKQAFQTDKVHMDNQCPLWETDGVNVDPDKLSSLPHVHVMPFDSSTGYLMFVRRRTDDLVETALTRWVDYGWRAWFNRPIDILIPAAEKWLEELMREDQDPRR